MKIKYYLCESSSIIHIAHYHLLLACPFKDIDPLRRGLDSVHRRRQFAAIVPRECD